MFSYSRTWGLDDAKASLSQALSSQKFPHALLIHGPAGVGQNALVLDLVDLLICEAAQNRPCGECASCLGRKRNNLDSLIFVMPLEKKEKASSEGDGAGPPSATGAQVDELAEKAKEFHQDPYGFSRTEKSRINIAQVRDLQTRLSFSETLSRPRIVVILWAETMPQEAANALLKTLEEPPANTYFLLSSEDRASLLPTILSRCTQLAVFPMENEPFATLLAEKGPSLGIDPVPARLLPFAEGALGVLLTLHRNGGESLLEEARNFLEAALSGDWRDFSDYLEGSDAFAELESSAKLLHFLLRMIRLFHRLEILEARIQDMQPKPVKRGAAPDYSWTAKALSQQGFTPELAPFLGPLEKATNLEATNRETSNLEALTAYLEEVLAAVQSYAKPKVAALGLFLEFEQKQISKGNA
jgi:DNA polymerase III delta prime subunit